MNKYIATLCKAIDTITATVGKAVSWLSAILVLLVVYDVFSRYVFQDPRAWVRELEWHLFALLFLWGSAFALQKDKHVRVDLFYSRFSPRDQAQVNLIGSLFFLIPWCLVLIIFSWKFAMVSWIIGESSPEPNGLQAFYPIKFAIVVGFFLLLLQGISEMLKALAQWRSNSIKLKD